jgi:predicted nuclease of restriction endonuclease-like (RecB) superfamily
MARTPTKPKKAKPAKAQTALTTHKQAAALTDDAKLYERVRTILDEAQQRAARSINSEMVQAYWLIGQAIVEREQKGQQRAEYGKQVIESLAHRLIAEFGKRFQSRNLWWMRDFYLKFPILNALRSELAWTHYRLLLRVENANAREFYETEAAAGNWSTRQLERQINSFFYERTAMSTRKRAMLEQGRTTGEKYTAQDFVKDPYVLEFLGLKASPALSESTLESALLDHLQEFLLELGKGFSFVARQRRITVEGDHFYVDLVLYNRLLRCFVLVELKLGKLTHQDIGQMLFYTNYYSREVREEWENPAIGILLCADKNDAVVRYTLPESQQQIFAAGYRLYLPSEEEIVAEIKREQEAFALAERLEHEKPV